jgi:adenylosuccinate lyase
LTGVAGTLYKFAFDLRLLQSPPFGEWAEPFGKKQIGSSAMPFKRNPINAEKMDSLGRFVATLPNVVWHNAAHSLLERTLDDSANRRIVLPQAFLAVDELLRVGTRLIRDLNIRQDVVQRNLEQFGPFAATERLLMEAVKAGANRQEFHELIRQHSLTAWDAIRTGQANPLLSLLTSDPEVTQYVPAEQAPPRLAAAAYVGDAPTRARNIAHAANQARCGQVLLLGKRLYVARGNTLRAIEADTGQELMRKVLERGKIKKLSLNEEEKSLMLHVEEDGSLERLQLKLE